MAEPRLDRWLSPCVFVSTGIAFNILSAVITHYFIGLNNDRIDLIDSEIQHKQVLIDSQWQSKTEVERNKEFFILLLSDRPGDPAPSESYYHDYLKELMQSYNLQEFATRLQRHSGSDLDLLLDLGGAAQRSIIASIDDSYFEVPEMQKRRIPLEHDNSRLFSIAIFLQVTGLILVLAKDLRRH